MNIIKIGTGFCGPCKMQDKELDKLKDIDIQKIDADEDEETAAKYNVRSIPVTILFGDGGEEIKRWVGLVKADEIQKEINK